MTAGVSKFHRVTEKVVQDLPQAQPIGSYIDIRQRLFANGHLLAVGKGAYGIDRIGDRLAQRQQLSAQR